MKSLDEMSDSLNPLLVKEVRQLFHSKQYLVVMALFLLGELGVLFVMMLNYKDMSVYVKRNLGEVAFSFQCVGMSLAVLLICMFRTCQMFNKERLDKNLDYTRLCSIPPFTVASGKLCSSVLLMLVILSLIMPFMVISYFLRGISLQLMLIWIGILVPQYLVGIQLAIFVGAIGKKGAEALLLFVLAVVMPSIIGFGISLSFMGRGPKVERVALTLAMVAIGLFFQAFAWTVAMISRSNSNIMFHPRVCALSICVLYTLIYILCVFFLPKGFRPRPDNTIMMLGMIMSMVIGTIQLAFVFEREHPGARVMAERPKNRLLRACMFFLSSGRAGGISLSVLLMLFVGVFILLAFGRFSLRQECMYPIIISMYILFYCLFAIVLNRIFPKINTILGFVISVALWFVLPLIVGYSYATLTSMRDSAVFHLLLTTPLFVFADDWGALPIGIDIRVVVPLIPCILLLLVLCKYIVVEFRRFVNDDEEAAK